MRYYIYRDTQVLGPFAREELDRGGGLRPDTLICAETAAGFHDSDWRSLGEVAELAGMATLPATAVSVLETPLEAGESILARLELESLGVPTEEDVEPDWLRGLFEDADLKKRWGLAIEPPAAGSPPTDDRRRIAELTNQLEALQKRISELEGELARVAERPAAAVPAADPQPAALPQPTQAAPPPPEIVPPPKEMAAPEPMPEPALEPEELAAPAPRFALRPAEQTNAAGLTVHFSGARSFKSASAAPPAAEAVASPQATIAAPAVVPLSLEPPPAPEPSAAAASLEPPMTLQLAPPAAEAAAAPPVAAAPPAAAVPAAAADLVPLIRLDAPAASAPTHDVLARLAKPAPTPDAFPKPRAGSKKLLLVLCGLVLALGFVLFMFLRNSRDLKTMAAMGADQKPIGVESDDKAAGQQPPAAAPAPAAAPQAFADPADQAIVLVKEYPLDGDRGAVARWLSYEYTANPGSNNKESWDAGGVDATTYLVRYVVTPGPQSAIKEQFTYLFEADIKRQTVLGKNPAARQLLAGGPVAKPKAKPVKRRTARQNPRRVQRSPKPRQVPLAPLPSESELLPPADDTADFKNDTIAPAL